MIKTENGEQNFKRETLSFRNDTRRPSSARVLTLSVWQSVQTPAVFGF